MKTPLRLLLAAALAALPLNTHAADAFSNAAPSPQVKVDPRVELLSLIFRLAGNPEYSQAKVRAYAQDADKQFDGFRNHAVVNLARKLRRNDGVSYDAVMSLAVHLKDAEGLELAGPLEPWPADLDARWKPETVKQFLAAARQFVRAAGFKQFCEQHRGLYDTTAGRLRALLEKRAHLEWYQGYFGERPGATFRTVPGLLNGGCCYGPRWREPQGREALYCILGVWKTDGEGLPEFTPDTLGTLVHEFCHSFANPIIARHETELSAAGEKIFRHVAERMRSQAYGTAGTMLRESLVRACTVRFHRQFEGAEAARRAAQSEASRGFVWTADLARLLEEYEGQRGKYPTLDSFAPRVVAFFDEYAREIDKKPTALGLVIERRP